MQAQKTAHQFLSTPSARRATRLQLLSAASAGGFLSTPSARRATKPHRKIALPDGISIHALREEGDGVRTAEAAQIFISIHALREEGDLSVRFHSAVLNVFLSTPSARRATSTRASWCHSTWIFLSTPSARRATNAGRKLTCHCQISIHALREEGDETSQSPSQADTISIHALREEGDRLVLLAFPVPLHFYPRPPRGGRPTAAAGGQHGRVFLSTPSARRATGKAPVLTPHD